MTASSSKSNQVSSDRFNAHNASSFGYEIVQRATMVMAPGNYRHLEEKV
jgi:hypothetical protein